MCGLCFPKGKVKQQLKHKDDDQGKVMPRTNHDDQEQEEDHNGVTGKLPPFQEEQQTLAMGSFEDPQYKMQQQQQQPSPKDEKPSESLLEKKEHKNTKNTNRCTNEWISETSGFPSVEPTMSMDRTELPNMSKWDTYAKLEQHGSKVGEITGDTTEFPWTTPPVIKEGRDYSIEFPLSSPVVDSDDAGTDFPYSKPPKI